MTILPLAKRFLPLVRSGAKTSTIRKGVRPWTPGPAVIVSSGQRVQVRITNIRFACLSSLTEADAIKDGFESLTELLQTLVSFYPDLLPSDEVTIASFRTL